MSSSHTRFLRTAFAALVAVVLLGEDSSAERTRVRHRASGSSAVQIDVVGSSVAPDGAEVVVVASESRRPVSVYVTSADDFQGVVRLDLERVAPASPDDPIDRELSLELHPRAVPCPGRAYLEVIAGGTNSQIAPFRARVRARWNVGDAAYSATKEVEFRFLSPQVTLELRPYDAAASDTDPVRPVAYGVDELCVSAASTLLHPPLQVISVDRVRGGLATPIVGAGGALEVGSAYTNIVRRGDSTRVPLSGLANGDVVSVNSTCRSGQATLVNCVDVVLSETYGHPVTWWSEGERAADFDPSAPWRSGAFTRGVAKLMGRTLAMTSGYASTELATFAGQVTDAFPTSVSITPQWVEIGKPLPNAVRGALSRFNITDSTLQETLALAGGRFWDSFAAASDGGPAPSGGSARQAAESISLSLRLMLDGAVHDWLFLQGPNKSFRTKMLDAVEEELPGVSRSDVELAVQELWERLPRGGVIGPFWLTSAEFGAALGSTGSGSHFEFLVVGHRDGAAPVEFGSGPTFPRQTLLGRSLSAGDARRATVVVAPTDSLLDPPADLRVSVWLQRADLGRLEVADSDGTTTNAGLRVELRDRDVSPTRCDVALDLGRLGIPPGLLSLRVRAFDGPIDDANLQGDTTYQVWVSPTSAPAAPSGVALSTAADGIHATWNPPTLDDPSVPSAIEFWRRLPAGGAWAVVGSAEVRPGYWRDDSAAENVRYEYRARYVSAAGKFGPLCAVVTSPAFRPAPTIRVRSVDATNGAAADRFTSTGQPRVVVEFDRPTGSAADAGSVSLVHWAPTLARDTLNSPTRDAVGRYHFDPSPSFRSTGSPASWTTVGTHRFEAEALSPDGTRYRASCSYTIAPAPVPSPPSTVIPTAGDGRIKLDWSSVTPQPDEWWIYRSTVDGNFSGSPIVKLPGAYLHWEDTSAPNGVEHFYYVRPYYQGRLGAGTTTAGATGVPGPGLSIDAYEAGPSTIADSGFGTLARVRLEASVQPVTLRAIRPTRKGTSTAADIDELFAVLDSNLNNEFDTGEPILWQGRVQAGTSFFAMAGQSLTVVPGTPQQLLLRAYVVGTSAVGKTIGIDIPSDEATIDVGIGKYGQYKGGNLPFFGTTRTIASGDNLGGYVVVKSVSKNLMSVAGEPVTITCTAADLAPSGSPVHNVSRVEGHVDTLGAPGTGQAFAPSDGAFNSVSNEDCTLTISTVGWADGVHTVWVLVRDVLGNWGAATPVRILRSVDAASPVATISNQHPTRRGGFDAQGRFCAVFEYASGTSTGVYFTKWDPQTRKWSAAASVTGGAAGSCTDPVLLVQNNGAWGRVTFRSTATGFPRYGNTFDTSSGASLGLRRMDPAPTSAQFEPAIVEGAPDTTTAYAFTRVHAAGNPFAQYMMYAWSGLEFAAGQVADANNEQVALAGSCKTATAVELLFPASNQMKWSKWTGGAWPTPTVVGSCDTFPQQPSLVRTAAGTLGAYLHQGDVWLVSIGTGGPGTPRRLTTSANCAASVHLTTDGAGRIYAVWATNDGGLWYSASRDGGTAWSVRRPLGNTTTQRRDPIGAGPNGSTRAVVGWLEGDGTTWTLQAGDITVDDAAPTANTVTPVAGAELARSATVRVQVGGNLSGWRLEWGAGAAPSSWQTILAYDGWQEGTFDLPWDAASVPEGTATLRLTAISEVGANVVRTTALTADRTPPTIVSLAASRALYRPGVGDPISPIATFVGATASSYWIEDDGGGVVHDFGSAWSGTSPSGGAVADGLYWLVCRARDAAGNEATARVAVTIDNTAPELTITHPALGTRIASTALTRLLVRGQVSEPATIAVEFIGPGGTPLAGRVTPADDGAGLFAVIDASALASATYVVRTTAADGVGIETVSDVPVEVVSPPGAPEFRGAQLKLDRRDDVRIRTRWRRTPKFAEIVIDGVPSGVHLVRGTAVVPGGSWPAGRPVDVSVTDVDGTLIASWIQPELPVRPAN